MNLKLNELGRWVAMMGLGLLLAGCGTSRPDMADVTTNDAAHEDLVAELKEKVRAEEAARRTAEATAERARREADQARERLAASENGATIDPNDYTLPPNAEAGECFARVLIPPVYRESQETVIVKDGRDQLEVVPASYEWDAEEIVVKEATERLEVVPASYEWVEERVLVKPARTKLEVVPAKYETETEKILVTPARKYWKKGRGLIERLDNNTGEIMCLIEEPAVYKTVSKQVLTSPESVREIEIPAEYTTVKRMVEKSPATTRSITIPAEYDQVKVLKEKQSPSTRKHEIEPEYREVTKREMVEPSRLEWHRVFCETNMDGEFVRRLQTALESAGHSPGPIDGIYGPKTRHAVSTFQRSKSLPTGGLTYETLEALQLSI